MWVLWPSFLVACAGSAVVFAFIDPQDVAVFGHITAPRQQAYAIAFFFLWGVAALSSLVSLKLLPDNPS